MASNSFKPSEFKSYGWAGAPRYKSGDMPIPDEIPNEDRTIFAQQFAYEWLDSGDPLNAQSNPPFLTGSGGRLMSDLRNPQGGIPRILRGYIRRADYDTADQMTKARLYFMYNPESITRDYQSYLDSTSLDPFNTVYQSGNLVAPPSYLDFSFDLFFDRQEESARNAAHPGVFVDYQFFDMVVRNVTPTNDVTNNTLPDNGIMMVNPRDITVVFSPNMTVQGRPLNARVVFEKFTHRMTPIRMRISLQMRVVYFGPTKPMNEYTAETFKTSETVPFDEIAVKTFTFTFREYEEWGVGTQENVSMADQAALLQSNQQVNSSALEAAVAKAAEVGTTYSGSSRHLVWEHCDDASFVIGGYKLVDMADELDIDPPAAGGRGTTQVYLTTAPLLEKLKSGNWKKSKLLWSVASAGPTGYESSRAVATKSMKDGNLSPGDLLFRVNYLGLPDHVAWFRSYANPGSNDRVKLYHADSTIGASGVGETEAALDFIVNNYNWCVRPQPLGQSTAVNTYVPTVPTTAAGVVDLAGTVEVRSGAYPPASGPTIRLEPAAAKAFENWMNLFGGSIPCTSGWRSYQQQANNYAGDKNRFAPPERSWHVKGRAVDVDMNFINSLGSSGQSRLRTTAKQAGWGQPRWRQASGDQPGYECGCNHSNGTKTDEAWHFSWGGCG